MLLLSCSAKQTLDLLEPTLEGEILQLGQSSIATRWVVQHLVHELQHDCLANAHLVQLVFGIHAVVVIAMAEPQPEALGKAVGHEHDCVASRVDLDINATNIISEHTLHAGQCVARACCGGAQR
jgi:hypothetical protein